MSLPRITSGARVSANSQGENTTSEGLGEKAVLMLVKIMKGMSHLNRFFFFDPKNDLK